MTIYREFEDIIKDCDKIRIVNFLKTLFRGDSRGNGKFGGTEQQATDDITILGSVTLFTQDGRPKPVLCCAKQMDGILTERSSRRKQFDIAVKVLKDNFVNPYMGNGPIQGSFTQGLFYFFDEPGNFRLSLVTAEISAGKMELNNYRRQSFFVEAGKNNKTFRTRLCKTIANYDELKSAFDVEKLSDEFFREYKVFYEDIVQYITGARYIEVKKNKYERKDMSGVNHEIYDQFVEIYGDDAERAVRNYVKKLMGRLVFIQFLQKKGWLGNLAGANTWNFGDRDFMQSLFLEVSPEDRENFIDNVLEEIFFGEFNTKENERHIKNATLKKYRFPFLNCGLFDRDSDDKLDFKLPAAVFCNLKFPDTERKAPNIKDWSKKRNPYFDDRACGLFDFFDRFNFTIDENDPTDAEVSVDPEMLGKIFENLLEDNKDKGAFYTPKEIVNYMVNESLIAYLGDEPDIRNFVLMQDASTFVDSKKTQLDAKLAEVKICDPAIGSGAFPMGLLNLLCKCRQSLQPAERQHDKKMIAALKRDIIQQNIYGVDIEKGAVDIARLRFWLSLIVDEDTPEVLPNLEFKIMQGNSLLESYEGIDLSGLAGEKGARTRAQSKIQTSLVFDEKQAMEQIQKDLNKFYKTDSHAEKESLTLSINNNVREYIKYIAPQKSKEIDAMPVPNDKFFLWHTYFRDVFSRKGKEGFDIVIGNPPYGVSIKGDYRKSIVNELGKAPDFEIYYYFIIAASRLLKQDGIVSYIIPNTWLFNMFASEFRRNICAKWNIVEVLDCSKFEIFENATVRNSIVFLQKPTKTICQHVFYKSTKNAENFAQLIDQNRSVVDKEDLLQMNQNWGLAFKLSPKIIQVVNKISNKGKCLSQYCPEISQGLIAYDKYQGQSDAIIKSKAYHYSQYKPGLKSWLWGEDVRRYSVHWNGKEWLDYCKGIANPRQPKFFTGKRLLVREITNPSIYAAITDDELYNDPAIIIVLNNQSYPLKIVLAILNSKLATFFHFNHSPKATKGSFPKILVQDIKDFPIPLAKPAQQQPIIDLVDSILAEKTKDPSADTSKLEDEIDNLVYELYGLTPEEIAIVKGGSPAQNDDGEKARSDKPHETRGSVADDDFLQGEDL